MELSWIQKHVLLVLIRMPSARVKDLQPADIPANQFMYHLDGLMARGLVTKIARGTYTLTPKGQKLAGTFSTLIEKQVEDVKTVILLYGKVGEKYLLFRWSRQPYLGFVTPPHQRIPRGKSITDAIETTLNNKLGLPVSTRFKTSSLIKIIHNDELVSHLNALIYEVSLSEAEWEKTMRNGEVFLGVPNKTPQIMDGVETFLRTLEDAKEPIDCEWHY